MERNAQMAGRMNEGFARVDLDVREAREVLGFVRRGERVLYRNTAARKGAKIIVIVAKERQV